MFGQMISLRLKPRPAGTAFALTSFLTICALLVTLAATAQAAPEGGEEDPPPVPQLVFEPDSYDFGLQQAYSQSSQTMQLRNVGEATTQVYSTDIIGPGFGAFWINAGDCSGRILNPSETCWVQVNFNPYEAAPYEAQLRASGEGGSTFTASLSGEGGRAVLGPVADPTSFGAVEVGSEGVVKAIEISNSGNLPGGAFFAVIAGGAFGSFHILDENCTGILLAPAASCTLLVSFEPLSTGVKTARLGLFGDQDGGTQVTLTGVGIEAPTPQPSAKSLLGSASLEPARKQRTRAKHRRRKASQRNRRLRAAVSAQRPIR